MSDESPKKKVRKGKSLVHHYEVDPFAAATMPDWLRDPHNSATGLATGHGKDKATAGEPPGASERDAPRGSRKAAQQASWTVAAATGAAGADEQAMIRAAIKASVADERARRKEARVSKGDEKQA